jgi:hypothetical protein
LVKLNKGFSIYKYVQYPKIIEPKIKDDEKIYTFDMPNLFKIKAVGLKKNGWAK